MWLGDREGEASFSRSIVADGDDAIGAGGNGATGVYRREVVGVERQEAVTARAVLVFICSVIKGKRGPRSELLGPETTIGAGKIESTFSTRSISSQSAWISSSARFWRTPS